MAETLNILVLCYEYPPIGGGGGVGAKQYAEAWATGGHRVTVLTSRDRGLPACEHRDGVEVLRVWTAGKKDRATSTMTSMACYILSGTVHILWRYRKFRRMDILNTHFAIPTGPLGLIASKLLRLPNVLTIIGGDIYDPTKKSSPHRSVMLRHINSIIINAASHVVAISSDTKKRAEQYYRLKKSITVINYGFHPTELRSSRRSSLGLRDDVYYLIAVGRLVSRKGFEYLIQSLRHLPQNIELLLIGDGPLEPTLRTVADQAGVQERVEFLGYRLREQILDYLQTADCFVLSSLHEGLGIVVQEAMYAGLPIVATDNGGQVDLVLNERNGLLVKPEDVTGLASAIARVYSDKALAQTMAANNRRDIQRCFMAVNREEYISLFQMAIAQAL